MSNKNKAAYLKYSFGRVLAAARKLQTRDMLLFRGESFLNSCVQSLRMFRYSYVDKRLLIVSEDGMGLSQHLFPDMIEWLRSFLDPGYFM